MVVHRTIAHLKTRPHAERKVVAGGIAVSLVAILFSLWVLFLFQTISADSRQMTVPPAPTATL